MRHQAVSILIASVLGITSNAAWACSVPTEPFDPNKFRHGIILDGIVKSSNRSERDTLVNVDVRGLVQGTYTQSFNNFKFIHWGGPGTCRPASTEDLPRGQRIIVYVSDKHGVLRVNGWLHFNDALRKDRRVIAYRDKAIKR